MEDFLQLNWLKVSHHMHASFLLLCYHYDYCNHDYYYHDNILHRKDAMLSSAVTVPSQSCWGQCTNTTCVSPLWACHLQCVHCVSSLSPDHIVSSYWQQLIYTSYTEHTHTHSHTLTHTYMHTLTHTLTYTHTHSHTQTHLEPWSRPQ